MTEGIDIEREREMGWKGERQGREAERDTHRDTQRESVSERESERSVCQCVKCESK